MLFKLCFLNIAFKTLPLPPQASANKCYTITQHSTTIQHLFDVPELSPEKRIHRPVSQSSKEHPTVPGTPHLHSVVRCHTQHRHGLTLEGGGKHSKCCGPVSHSAPAWPHLQSAVVWRPIQHQHSLTSCTIQHQQHGLSCCGPVSHSAPTWPTFKLLWFCALLSTNMVSPLQCCGPASHSTPTLRLSPFSKRQQRQAHLLFLSATRPQLHSAVV